MSDSEIRPNQKEIEFLTLAYNKFYDNFEEIFDDSFWKRTPYYRFSKIKDSFSIYSEALQYPPIQWAIEHIGKTRPPGEEMIAGELFKCIRNILIHFPFFSSWEEVTINKSLINWQKEGHSIDSFFQKYSGHKTIKYRIWDSKKKEMVYLSINFPKGYNTGKQIYLKDILIEKEGVKFSFAFMRKVLDTQVDSSP